MSTTDTRTTIPAAPDAEHTHDAEHQDPAADRRAQLDAARADHDVKHEAIWEKYTRAMQDTAELCAEYDARVHAITAESHQ